jgi:tetratricopeptide (TPR) repeat protein
MSNAEDLKTFPLPLPASLSSYNELFAKSPNDAIKRLEAQFKKRLGDPICAVLLAWFYYQTSQRQKAMEYAVKAKVFAPGSPSMGFAPYFLEHPSGFEAWTPETAYSIELPGFFVDRALSLDELIERLSSADSSKIVLTEHSSVETDMSFNDHPSAGGSILATETLAGIYEKQGETQLAISVYRQLLDQGGEKSDYYRSKIEALQSKASTD